MRTVSIIIPIYNAEKYLGRCLDSLLSQTFCDWEALCVNDGSTDSSKEIILDYAAKDARFRLIDKPNGGVADARNAGLDVADGEYLMFVDPDDFIHPQTLEIAVALSRRDLTDIVCWTYDRDYRSAVLSSRQDGKTLAEPLPETLRRRYEMGDVESTVTHDMVSHLTEMEKPMGVQWPIRHFYLWQFLFRSKKVSGLRFIKELTIYEDFPWLSELQLRNHPSVTITQLPLYYYYPNTSSIDMSTGAGSVRARCLMKGLLHCCHHYNESDPLKREVWSRLCKWPVIRSQLRRNLEQADPSDREELRASLENLRKEGGFNFPPGPGYWLCRLKIYFYMNAA